MKRFGIQTHRRAGMTLAEVLVVFGIIMIMVGLILSVFIRVYQVLRTWQH